VEVDGHMVCNTGGERITEYLALLDQGDIMFSNEVVVNVRVSARFSEKSVGSIGGGRDRKTTMGNNKFERIDHVQE